MLDQSNDQFKTVPVGDPIDADRVVFRNDSVKHQSDVIYLMNMATHILKERSLRHDNDKLEFPGNLVQWKDYFRQGKHFQAFHGNTHHHKEDVEDFFGVIEMLCDWVAASACRGSILDPNVTRLPELRYDELMRNTLHILVNIWNSR